MYKSVKIHEEAYNDAKRLEKLLEKKDVIEGLYDVKLSTAIGYAIKKALKDILAQAKKKKEYDLDRDSKAAMMLSEKALKKDWDNEYDERWNDY